MSSPWPFVAWGMYVIGPIEPPASNGHCFILVAIDYFTKWVEATSHKSVNKKVVANFAKNNLICHFGVSKSIIMDNGANLNSHLMKDISEQFKITHRNSTTYRPHMNGAVEAANKKIKRILRKMVDNYKNWQEQLPYALLGYRTTTITSTGATPYLLIDGTKAVIALKVKIPSLRIIQDAELKDAEWVRNHYQQLAMIEEKRMVAVYHEQLFFLLQDSRYTINQLTHNKGKWRSPNCGERHGGVIAEKGVLKRHLTARVTEEMNDKDASDQEGHNGWA
ncbi:uncharacterized protein LOC132044980 [Lycium ferocissimum]|uniref:uncharacterized protein LOC132044980 n=1 Tax=Lycium ferocissimum TaxID=112874 RepID=UPI0028156D16|nr:uncharacterized protein LOC132044980 [Lycium ferocissimum]